jgi:outer membrane protein TolC
MVLALALVLGAGTGRVQATGLTLEEALTVAEGANFRVAKARAKVETALSQLREAEAAYAPRLTLDNDWEVSGPLPGSDADPGRGGVLSVTARRTLATRPKSLPVELARLTWQAAERELADELENVRLAVLTGYVGLRKADLAVNAAGLALAQATAAEEEVATRLSLGTAGTLELAQVKAERTAAQLASARARNQLRLAQARLNQSLGRDVATPLALAESPLPGIQPEAGGTEDAASRRFDLFLLENQLERARLAAAGRVKADALGVTVGGNVVGSDASAGLSWGSADGNLALTAQGEVWKVGDDLRAAASSSARRPYWSVQVGFSLPLSDGGVEKEKSRQEEVSLAQLGQTLTEQERLAALEIAEARLAWEEAEELIVVRTLEAETARERLRNAEARLALGVETRQDLLEAQLDVVKAERASKEAVWDGLLAAARLRRASGRAVW